MDYLLFAGTRFYPDGGAKDLRGFYDSLHTAVAAGAALIGTEIPRDDPEFLPEHYTWWHVYSLTERKIVAEACGDSGISWSVRERYPPTAGELMSRAAFPRGVPSPIPEGYRFYHKDDRRTYVYVGGRWVQEAVTGETTKL